MCVETEYMKYVCIMRKNKHMNWSKAKHTLNEETCFHNKSRHKDTKQLMSPMFIRKQKHLVVNIKMKSILL